MLLKNLFVEISFIKKIIFYIELILLLLQILNYWWLSFLNPLIEVFGIHLL